MIFNEDLDKSLYLILKNDNKNKSDIVRLLGLIPNDVYNQISDRLIDFEENYQNDEPSMPQPIMYDMFPIMTGYVVVNRMDDKYTIEINSSYVHITKKGNYDESIYFALSTDPQNLGTFRKTKTIHNENRKMKSKEDIYTYEIFEIKGQRDFVRMHEEKISLPKIMGINDKKIPQDLTLKYVNDKFNKNNK